MRPVTGNLQSPKAFAMVSLTAPGRPHRLRHLSSSSGTTTDGQVSPSEPRVDTALRSHSQEVAEREQGDLLAL
jgi:hypothetical protein